MVMANSLNLDHGRRKKPSQGHKSLEPSNMIWQKTSDIRHSMRLNTELAARAWLILGSSIVGVNIILRSVIHDFYAPFIRLTKKISKKFRNHFSPILVFSFQPTVHNGRVSRGRVCCCGCWC